MKRLIWAALATMAMTGLVVQADSTKHKKHADSTRVAVHVAFGKSDVEVIRTYYAPRYRNLPPGLQKKIARGGQLPPGWRKKIEPFPPDLDRRLPPCAPGYRRGVIDGHAVIYIESKQTIVDVAVLF